MPNAYVPMLLVFLGEKMGSSFCRTFLSTEEILRPADLPSQKHKPCLNQVKSRFFNQVIKKEIFTNIAYVLIMKTE